MSEGHRITRVTVDVDAEVLAHAQEALGASTVGETLERSLAEVVRRDRLARLARHRFPGLTPQVVSEIRRGSLD